jgi:hypothetical protein
MRADATHTRNLRNARLSDCWRAASGSQDHDTTVAFGLTLLISPPTISLPSNTIDQGLPLPNSAKKKDYGSPSHSAMPIDHNPATAEKKKKIHTRHSSNMVRDASEWHSAGQPLGERNRTHQNLHDVRRVGSRTCLRPARLTDLALAAKLRPATREMSVTFPAQKVW